MAGASATARFGARAAAMCSTRSWVKVRISQIDAGAKDAPRRSRIARHVVEHLDGYLSANQLGITIASLALGFLGEPLVRDGFRETLRRPAAALGGGWAGAAQVVASDGTRRKRRA